MTETVASVSVVIPMFNSDATIERALNSVAAQTLLPQEVIVVDDGSDDLSASIVERWSNSKIAVTLIKHSNNLGPAASRNTGWNHATQKFVAFLDADDTWHPRKLEIQYEWMAKSPRVAACGTLYSLNICDQQLFVSSIEAVPTKRFGVFDLLIKNRFSTPSAMVRRDISQRFDNTFRYSEDYLLWMTIAALHEFVYRIELPLTILHKNTYGVGGLSSDLLRMLRGEMHAFRSLANLGAITRLKMVLAMTWSILKFTQRVPRSFHRRYTQRFLRRRSLRA